VPQPTTGGCFLENVSFKKGVEVEQNLSLRLQDLVLDSPDVGAFLQELSVLSAGSVTDAAGLPVSCAITLTRQRKSVTVAGSCPEARQLDEIQQLFGDGPCMEAMRESASVLVRDTRADERWVRYCRVVADRGQLSILGVPLALDHGATASMSFFAPDVDAFTPDIIRTCETFACQAGKALRLAVRIGVSQELKDDVLAAMKSRTSINLASGIVMGQSRCTQAEAIAILTKVSNNRNVKLRIVAEEILRNYDTSVTADGITHFDI
jgi:hypothetical protein